MNCSTTSFLNSCRTIWLRSSGPSNLLCYLGRQFIPVPAACHWGSESFQGVLPPPLCALAGKQDGCRLLTWDSLHGAPKVPPGFQLLSCWVFSCSHAGSLEPICGSKHTGMWRKTLKAAAALQWRERETVFTLWAVFSGNVVVSWHIGQGFSCLTVYCFFNIWLTRSAASQASVLAECWSPPQMP